MHREAFTDAALVLLGHGTTLNEDSAVPVHQHAAELRHRAIFAEVREAFWKQPPQVADVLAAITAPRVFIVPFFISEGYFSETVIPPALGFAAEGQGGAARVQQRGSQRLLYCRPVGTHDSMTSVLLGRVRQVLEKFPFPRIPRWNEITLCIAGHGTERDVNSRQAIERQVALIQAHHLFAEVSAVFMEEEPRIKDCCRVAPSRNIVIVPFFVSDGLHVREDIPVLLGEPILMVKDRLQRSQPTWRNPTEKYGKLVWYGQSVGTDPKMAEVILDRVREAQAAQRRHEIPEKHEG